MIYKLSCKLNKHNKSTAQLFEYAMRALLEGHLLYGSVNLSTKARFFYMFTKLGQTGSLRALAAGFWWTKFHTESASSLFAASSNIRLDDADDKPKTKCKC